MNLPERYNKFLAMDMVQLPATEDSAPQHVEWSKDVAFSGGETEILLELGRPDLDDFEVKPYKSTRFDDSILGNDEEYHYHNGKNFDENFISDPFLPSSDPKRPIRAPKRGFCVQAKYHSQAVSNDNAPVAYCTQETHYGRGIFCRAREVNEMVSAIDKNVHDAAIDSAMESLAYSEENRTVTFDENELDVKLQVVKGAFPLGGIGDDDDAMRRDGLEHAAEMVRKKSHAITSRRVHHRRILPRTVYSSSRQVSVRSSIFCGTDNDMKSTQKNFELLMDYLIYSDAEPDPILVTIEDHGYYAWLFCEHERYIRDQLLGEKWLFVSDRYGLKLLSTWDTNISSGDTVGSQRSHVSNVSHIEKDRHCPGEILFDTSGCIICTRAEITDEDQSSRAPLYVKYPEKYTLRCFDNVVIRSECGKPVQDKVHSLNHSSHTITWVGPPATMLSVFHEKVRCDAVSKMYDMIYEYLLAQKRISDHEKEMKAQEETKAKGKKHKHDGILQNRIITAHN